MERSEPTLVPEWLRSSGGSTGVGNSANSFASSSPRTDGPATTHFARNRNSKTATELDSPRSTYFDRSFSSNSRRGLGSNGSTKNAYSSFGRSHRSKDGDREKERSNYEEYWDHDISGPLESILSARGEKDPLRRSHSMISRKQGDLLPRKALSTIKNGGSNNNHGDSNGIGKLSGVNANGTVHRSFEKDFPSLGGEEKLVQVDLGRVSSPGLPSPVQSLPLGNSALIGREVWTSALAEVPGAIGSSIQGSGSVKQNTISSSAAGTSSSMANLNMAEALAQAPPRAITPPQLSLKTQRLEELAIKQSRQLIPVTPSVPKSSALGSSDKSKTKAVFRPGEINVVGKNGPQQSSVQPANQSLRGGQTKTEMNKTPHGGKYLVLKPSWENGVPAAKDVASPTNPVNAKASDSQVAIASAASASASLKNGNSGRPSSLGGKSNAVSVNALPAVERRPSSSHAQSRNEFFSLLKRKTSTSTVAQPESGPADKSPNVDFPAQAAETETLAGSPRLVDNGVQVNGLDGSGAETDRFSNIIEDNIVYPDEEEAAFLRSLGWEENAGEEEGLTEEEIAAFYQEYMKLRPSLKVSQGIESVLPKLSESNMASLGAASTELSSSNCGAQA